MKNKVYFFNKVNNFLINFFPYTLSIGTGVFILFKFNLIKRSATKILKYNFTDLEVGIILTIIEIVITTILTLILKFSKQFMSLSTFIKHKLYSQLRHIFIKPKHKLSRILFNKNLNSFYYTSYKPTIDQKKVSKRVYEILCKDDNNSNDNKVLWIQGETFSGKTMAVSNILINIISKKNYYKAFKRFDNRIVYIDLINDNFNRFMDKYKKLKFEKSILIIDNTYILSECKLISLINEISDSAEAKLIIVCMREFQEILNDPYYVEKLTNKMKIAGELYHIDKIKNISSPYINESIILNYNFNSFSEIDQSTQFHCMNMCEKDNNSKSKIFIDIINYLNGKINKDNFNHKIIFMISSLCIFTGSFTKEQLIMHISSIKEKILFNVTLSELHSCGFIDRSPYEFGKIYILNSQIAKHYFKLGYTSKSFKNIAFDIINKQYEYNINKNFRLAFLYGCFLKDNKTQQSEIFDSIAINTNFRVLLNDINYIASVEKSIISLYNREIGILYDRTGEFLKSRNAFRSLLIDAQKQNNINLALESFYRLVQIDHTEYSKHNQLKDYQPDSPYLKLQKKYWKLHIDMHLGKFALSDFIDLLNETKSIFNKVSYDNLHLLRRIYFDAYRLYYLDGSNNANKLLKIKENGDLIQKYLSVNLEEFNLYYQKFTILFLLSKDILYNLVVYDSTVDYDIFKKFINDLDITYESMSNKNLLLETCIKLCIELENGFEKIGDKTFNFIRYYRTELLIIKNDYSSKSLIKQYRNFAKYEIEYCLYAEFIKLKYQISQLINLERISKDNQYEYENLKSNVYKQFKNINNFFNGSYTNKYAIMRYKIYELFVTIFDKKAVPSDLFTTALNFAEKNKYNRESRLLSKIKDLNYHVPFGWCKNVLLYYPIVPQ